LVSRSLEHLEPAANEINKARSAGSGSVDGRGTSPTVREGSWLIREPSLTVGVGAPLIAVHGLGIFWRVKCCYKIGPAQEE
jgi:hypothetical protein